MASTSAAVLPAVSPLLEMGAYEALWAEKKSTFKTIADLFRKHPGALPSDFIHTKIAEDFAERVLNILNRANIKQFGLRIHGAGEYPNKLRDADHPIELLYFQGWWDYVESPCVSVVGTRKPSLEGQHRAAKLTKLLVDDNFTIVSGLATGIDTIAHQTAIASGGRTIAVIGTPISATYPSENRELQQLIAKEHLLISQVPVYRYSISNFFFKRTLFPVRNVTMSALTLGTIIVEAGETSGALIQARAALHQNRKLFILESCFQNENLKWPARFEEMGAIRVREYEDIRRYLGDQTHKG